MGNTPKYTDEFLKAIRLIEETFNSLERELYYYISNKVGNKKYLIEDLLMETHLQLCEKPTRILSVKNPKYWVFGIANNLCKKALKRETFRGKQESSIEELYDEKENIHFDIAGTSQSDSEILAMEILVNVLGANSPLTSREKELIRDILIEELSVQELADRYGLSKRTVLNVLSQSRIKIRAYLSRLWHWEMFN